MKDFKALPVRRMDERNAIQKNICQLQIKYCT